MPGHDQADRQEQHLHDLFGDRVQRIAQDALKRDAAFLDRGDDAGEARLGQNHAGRGFGDVGRGRDRDADLRLAQRRRVVGAVAAHADGMAAVLKRLDELVFVLRQHAGEDRELLGMDGVGDRPGRTDGAVKPHRLRHDGRGRRRVARHHHGAHAQPVQFADQRRRVRARRVAERDQPHELHRRRGAGGHRQHAKSLGFEFVRRRRRSVRRRLDESDDDGEGALHDPLRASGRIRRRRLGHLLGRIEGGELDQARRIGDGLARGGGANGAIDRVLAAIGARQRGQRQHVRLVEARHRVHARHGQRVARQRAGLVGAQDIHRRGFIDRGEPGRQHALLGQRPRAERRGEGEGGRQRDRDRSEHRRSARAG